MQTILSVQEMRSSDAFTIAQGTPGRELMRRAAEGIFNSASWRPPVAVVCGSGNNAGDGYAVASMLAEIHTPVEIYLEEERFSEDGKTWYEKCRALEIPVHRWAETETLRGFGTVLDCIFGTGFHGCAGGGALRMIRLINASGAWVISADINSGLNGDSGMAAEAVRSDQTFSIGSWQPGHFLNMAKDLMRQKKNIDIGIRPMGAHMALMEADDAAKMFPPRPNFSHKGDFGYLALIGGSLRYSGAVRLSALANAAMRSGAGVVRLCTPRMLCEKMIPEVLEATLFPLAEADGSLVFREEEFREALKGTRAAAFGMGIGNTDETRKAVRFLLMEYKGTLILDADGLNALAAGGCEGLEKAAGPVVLTPHPGEFARLSGCSIAQIQETPVPLAEAFARKYGVILLLKGPATIVTDGEKTILTDRGSPGMATAGSGDVLSGVLAAMAASGTEPLMERIAAGAWITGLAGEIAQEKTGDVSMTAGDTVQSLAQAVARVRAFHP